jgi:dienelactone hydrolase
MVYFWYPTSEKLRDTRGVYYPGAAQMEKVPEVQARMHRAFNVAWPGILSGEIFSHAAERAPAVTLTGRFPIVVFSHGLGGTGFHYTCLIEDLVSRGYVVAAIEHTYSAKAVWFPDGRVIPMEEAAKRPGGNGAGQGINEGAADVRFVLDRVTALDGNKREFLLAGRVDVKAAAAMGHSLGAEFATRACQLDGRFRACIDLDGGMVPVAALPLYDDGSTIRQPLLFLEAYHPESRMGGLSHETIAEYYKTKEEQLRSCPRGTYDVVLRSEGIEHPSFSDLPVLFGGHDGYPDTAVALHHLDLIERFIREFLDKNLKQEKAPLLDGSESIPEATVTAYGR